MDFVIRIPRFLVTMIDVGELQPVSNLVETDSLQKIPLFYYAIKDMATGEIIGNPKQDMGIVVKELYDLRKRCNDDEIPALLFEHTIEEYRILKKENKI